MTRGLWLWLIATGVLLSCRSAVATQHKGEAADSVAYILESIVVYGDRFRAASSVTELDIKKIEALNAASVADVLRSALGLAVTSGAKAETETRIRGFSASNILVLVDGRPINPGYYGKVDLSMLPLDNVAKIVIIKGPADAAYGANSMGGVINIITQNGSENSGTEISGESGAGSYRKLGLSHSRQIGRLSYWLSLYENRSDGFRLSDAFTPTPLEGGGLRDNASFHKAGFDGKIRLYPSDRSIAALSLGYHWAQKDIAATVYPWDNPQYREFPEWHRFHTTLSGFLQASPRLELKATTFVDAYNDRFVSYLTPERDREKIEYESLLENWTVGATADFRLRLGSRNSVLGGLNFKSDLTNKQPAQDEPWVSYRTYIGAAFAQGVWHPASSTELMFGLGYYGFVPANESSGATHLCPVITVRQKLPFQLQAHAGASKAVRYPTIHKLYSESSGNQSLKPESAFKYEVGINRWFFGNGGETSVDFEMLIFYNELSDLIYRESRSYQYRNIGEANLYGGEFQARWRSRQLYFAEFGYGLIKSDKSSHEALAGVPQHTLRVNASAVVRSGTTIGYQFGYFDERTTRLTSITLRAYSLHHVNIRQHISRGLTLRFEVNNITDVDYQEELGYPGPGREYRLGFNWRL